MKQAKTTKQPLEIKIGMQVKHKFIPETLTVAPDEKGEAYSGEGFTDNEISLSHAKIELANGNLEIITKDILTEFIEEIRNEFKNENWDYLDFIAERVREKQNQQPDSKEGLHTQGKWTVLFGEEVNAFPEIRKVGNLIAICPNEDCSMEEAEANAELIVKAVNFYSHVKDLVDKHPSNNDKPYELAHISNNDLSAYKLHTKILSRLIDEGVLDERKALLEHLENCVELLKWLGSGLTDKGKATVKEANIFLNNAKNI